jgi:Mat/Ecp fimbriae outer membrane usher protein
MSARRYPGGMIRGVLIAGLLLGAANARANDGAASAARAADRAHPFYRLSGAVPEGFEQLTGPQRALVDVYFGKQRILRQMVTYTPDTVVFDDPEAIVAALPESIDPAALLGGLSGGLPVNAERLCQVSLEADCDNLEPALAGVIFDAGSFRADVFVNRQLLVVKPVLQERYLPRPETGFSALQNIMATAAGSDQGDSMLNVGSFTTIAYDDTRLVSEASATDEYGLTFDRLFIQRDRERYEYAGGLFRTVGRAFSFSGDHQIGGLRVASTLNTRTDLALAYGTPIAISLASRGRVDLIKEGRLHGSRFYDAGNHMVDTSMLPEGAYELVVRITEGGSVREETRFFSKSSRLPPMDQPLYQVEAGSLLETGGDNLFPEATDEWIARAGHSRRLTDTFGIDAGLAGTGSDQLVEFGLFRMDTLGDDAGSYYQVQASSFAGTGSSSGISLSGLLRFGEVYAGVDVRSVSSDTVHSPLYGDLGYDAVGRPDAVLADPAFADPFDDRSPDGTDGREASDGYRRAPSLIPQALDQANLTVQFPLLGGVAGITASEIRRDDYEDVSRQSLTFRRMILKRQPGLAELRADLNFEDDRVQALVGVRFHLRRDRITSDITPRYRYDDAPVGGDTTHGYQLDATSNWSNPDFAGGELRLATSASKRTDEDVVGASAELYNRLVQTRLSVDRFQSETVEQTSWAGSVFTSVLSGDDTWAMGGQNAADAAILVSLVGRAPDAEFEVVVDGYTRGVAKGGSTTALHLPAYKTYEVRIKPRRSSFVQYDDSPRSVTLYPGNVARLDWEVKSLFVVLGRVVDSEGRGIPNASIHGAQGLAATDADGFFQAEVASADESIELEFLGAAGRCSVSAPIVQQRRGVAFLQTVSCDPQSDGIARVDGID